jgi:hypothetical protein
MCCHPGLLTKCSGWRNPSRVEQEPASAETEIDFAVLRAAEAALCGGGLAAHRSLGLGLSLSHRVPHVMRSPRYRRKAHRLRAQARMARITFGRRSRGPANTSLSLRAMRLRPRHLLGKGASAEDEPVTKRADRAKIAPRLRICPGEAPVTR